MKENGTAKALKLAFQNGMKSKPKSYFQPLAAYVYADGQKMVTYSGIVLSNDDTEPERFFATTGIRDWPLSTMEGDRPLPINVPELSVKERMLLDSLLPASDAKTMQAALNFLIDEDEEASLEGLADYIRYYRQYPYFSRVVI